MQNYDELKNAIEKALRSAVEAVGEDVFFATSFFPNKLKARPSSPAKGLGPQRVLNADAHAVPQTLVA